MTTSTAPQASRYQIIANTDGTFGVRDGKAHKWLTMRGVRNLSERDAHDLHQEYIWS